MLLFVLSFELSGMLPVLLLPVLLLQQLLLCPVHCVPFRAPAWLALNRRPREQCLHKNPYFGPRQQ